MQLCLQFTTLLGVGHAPGWAGGVPRGVSPNNYVGKFKMDASKTGDVKNNYFDEVFKAYPKMKLEADPHVEQ